MTENDKPDPKPEIESPVIGLVRAVLANRLAYWDACRALERHLGKDLDGCDDVVGDACVGIDSVDDAWQLDAGTCREILDEIEEASG